jgi:predicted DCC family thiol-disulfide oxidoreductase YuxK
VVLRGGVLDASLSREGHVVVKSTLQLMTPPRVDAAKGSSGALLANDEAKATSAIVAHAAAPAAASAAATKSVLASDAPHGAASYDEVNQASGLFDPTGLAFEPSGLDPSSRARIFAIGDVARVTRSSAAGDAEDTDSAAAAAATAVDPAPTLARRLRTTRPDEQEEEEDEEEEHSGLAHVAEMHAQVAVANVRRHSRGEPLLSYPHAAVGAARPPRVYCISLGEADGVLVFNGLVLSGMAPALAKRLIEWTKVAACDGRPVGVLVWRAADKAAAWMSRHVFPPPARKPRLVAPPGRAVVLFDAECMLCNSFVHWVIDHDPAGAIQFAPLQGELASEYLACAQLEADLSTVVVVDADGVHVRSAAALRVLRLCGPGWVRAGAAVAMLIPRPVADLGYRAVAAMRYRIFGKDDGSSCRRMTQSLQERFAPPRARSLSA